MWHELANAVCHYVGIASGFFVSHTFTVMRFKLSLFFLVLLGMFQKSVALETEARLNLISDIKTWVSNELVISEEQIEVLALDRRLNVPSCKINYEVSFPYQSSDKTVLAECKDIQWRAYIGLTINKEIDTYIYKENFPMGTVLKQKDLIPTKTKVSKRGLLKENSLVDNMVLNTNVEKDQIAELRHISKGRKVYKLLNDLTKGSQVRLTDVQQVIESAAKVSKNHLLIESVFKNSVTSRDLRSGTVLSYSDIKLQHKLLAAAKTITLGQKITKENTQIIEYYGKPAADSLKSIDDLEYMEALRTIQSGNPIRLSDIKRALMIKKGDSVLLETGKGQLLISIRMTALEEGKLDDQVDLMNPESGETVRAIVTGPGKTKGI
jgi:flagella basal body P-ring formation protein FlgA